jgi:hypothetical protein
MRIRSRVAPQARLASNIAETLGVTPPEKPADSLAEALARGREVRPKLAEATDKLNQAIAAAEQAIAALHLGVRAAVSMYSGPDHNPWYTNLVFGKDGKTWRLFIETGHPSHPDQEELTPLTNASREHRIRAVELLPDLVRELIVTAEQEIQRVEQKTSEANEFVANITREGSK